MGSAFSRKMNPNVLLAIKLQSRGCDFEKGCRTIQRCPFVMSACFLNANTSVSYLIDYYFFTEYYFYRYILLLNIVIALYLSNLLTA